MMKMRGLGTGVAVLAAGVWLVGLGARVAHAQDAKQIYEKSCLSCHGPGGKGDGPAGKMLKPPPPALSASKASDADMAKVIKEGGKALGRSPLMPAYGSKLTDDQINALVQYIRKDLAAK